MVTQVFRESRVAEVCSVCGQSVFAGDVAYRIGGEAVCADCVYLGEYVAEELASEPAGDLSLASPGRTRVKNKNGGVS